MSLLSFYHMQLGCNFNMLESDLALSKLAIGIDLLWSLARLMAAQILPSGPIGKIYGQNLSGHKAGSVLEMAKASLLPQALTPTLY